MSETNQLTTDQFDSLDVAAVETQAWDTFKVDRCSHGGFLLVWRTAEDVKRGTGKSKTFNSYDELIAFIDSPAFESED